MSLKTQTPDYYVKQGDTYRQITGTLKDAEGRPVNISGATVRFLMRAIDGTTNKVTAVATNLDDGTLANRGRVAYTWQTADINTPGDFKAEFEVSFAGAKDTYPRGIKQFLLIRVQEDLG